MGVTSQAEAENRVQVPKKIVKYNEKLASKIQAGEASPLVSRQWLPRSQGYHVERVL
jgi:hypothetical protein